MSNSFVFIGYRHVPKVMDFGVGIFRDGTNRHSATGMEAATSLGVAKETYVS